MHYLFIAIGPLELKHYWEIGPQKPTHPIAALKGQPTRALNATANTAS